MLSRISLLAVLLFAPLSNGRSRETTQIAKACGVAVVYRADTCDCLARHMPDRHIFGGFGPNACVFRNPPISFDPSKGSDAELAEWGIWKVHASELGDISVRKAYCHGVQRRYSGVGGWKNGWGPALTATWAPPDGAQCDLPGSLVVFCMRSHRPEPPFSPSPSSANGARH